MKSINPRRPKNHAYGRLPDPWARTSFPSQLDLASYHLMIYTSLSLPSGLDMDFKHSNEVLCRSWLKQESQMAGTQSQVSGEVKAYWRVKTRQMNVLTMTEHLWQVLLGLKRMFHLVSGDKAARGLAG